MSLNNLISFPENGGIVPPPVPPEVAAVDVAGRPHRDLSARIDPIQKTSLDCLIKTLQEKVTASHLKGKLTVSSLNLHCHRLKLNPVACLFLSLSFLSSMHGYGS